MYSFMYSLRNNDENDSWFKKESQIVLPVPFKLQSTFPKGE